MSHPRATLTLLGGCLAATWLVASGCASPPSPLPSSAVPTLAFPTIPEAKDAQFVPSGRPSTARGERLFRTYCTECHGEAGRGDGIQARLLNPKPPDFTDPVHMRDQRPDEYYRAISRGVFGSAMLAWEGTLTQEQIWDVLSHVWSLHMTPAQVVSGSQLYLAECAGCHGQEGDGKGPRAGDRSPAPTALNDARFLAGQTENKLLSAISRGVEGAPEHSWAGRLAENERQAAVAFLWTFLFGPIGP